MQANVVFRPQRRCRKLAPRRVCEVSVFEKAWFSIHFKMNYERVVSAGTLSHTLELVLPKVSVALTQGLGSRQIVPGTMRNDIFRK